MFEFNTQKIKRTGIMKQKNVCNENCPHLYNMSANNDKKLLWLNDAEIIRHKVV